VIIVVYSYLPAFALRGVGSFGLGLENYPWFSAFSEG
jgi:hypothetical protein